MTLFLEVFLAALIAGSLDTVVGFGGGLLLMPVLVLATGSIDAVLLAPIISLGWNIPRVTMLRRSIRWRSVALVSIGILPGTIAGTMLLESVDPTLVRVGIGILLIVFGGYYLLRLYVELPELKRIPEPILPLIGLAAAVIGTLLGAGHGPLYAITLSASDLSPREVVATNGALGGVLAVARIVILTIKGLLPEEIWILGTVGAVGGWIGGIMGVKLTRRSKDSTLELLTAIVLVAAGVRMVW